MNTPLAIIPAATRVEATAARVFIADVSGSMRGRKYDRLKDSLRRTASDVGAAVVAFNYVARWCDSVDDIPPPEGGTDLAAALRLAAGRFPAEVVVFSDGLPNDERAALEAAALVPGIISCVFVGDDGDRAGMDFMRKLARVGGGEAVHRDLDKVASIEADVRAILALDAPIAL